MKMAKTLFILCLKRVKNRRQEVWLHIKSYIRNYRLIKRMVLSDKPIFLELGEHEGRPGLEDWATVDMRHDADISLDLSKELPFPDNSVDKIYSSHLMEHFTYGELMNGLLSECRRILKPGGVFSMSVPNARQFVEYYVNSETGDPAQYCGWKPGYRNLSRIDALNYIAYMGDGLHKYMFDEDHIVPFLTKAEFRNARVRAFDAKLDSADRRHNSIYGECEK